MSIIRYSIKLPVLLTVFSLLLAFRCSDDAPTVEAPGLPTDSVPGDTIHTDTVPAPGDPLFPINATKNLCNYSSSAQASEVASNQVLLLAEKQSGQVAWWEDRKQYAVAVSVAGTYDCQLILFSSADLSKYVGQSVTFSGMVLPFVGKLPDSQIGGVEFFRVIDLIIAP